MVVWFFYRNWTGTFIERTHNFNINYTPILIWLLIYKEELKKLRKIPIISGLSLTFLISFPWYYFMELNHLGLSTISSTENILEDFLIQGGKEIYMDLLNNNLMELYGYFQ